PVANAGADQSVHIGATVHLDGSASTDADGNPLTYRWALTTRPTGSAATLANATTVAPTFVVDKEGSYVAQLIVNDGTVDSDPVPGKISTTNVKPVADAGPDQNAQVGETVHLDGRGSSDADHDPLTYAWSFTTLPAGSAATLGGATSAQASFVPDLAGTYVVQ